MLRSRLARVISRSVLVALTPGLTACQPDEASELTGMFSYAADAGMIVRCSDRRAYPVAQEEANAELERQYLELNLDMGQPALVTLQATIEQRDPMEGPLPVLTVVPHSVVAVDGSGDCGPFTATTVEHGRWRFVEVGELSTSEIVSIAVPAIEFRNGSVTGSTGCNTITGSYEIDGGQLEFGPIAMTRRACPTTGALETAIGIALQTTDRFLLRRDTLLLFNSEDRDPSARLALEFFRSH